MPMPDDQINTTRRYVQSGANVAGFMGVVMGFVFGGIGLTVLIFLWAAPFGEWDSPPIFFRIFGSFIAIAFVAAGSGAAVTSFRGRKVVNQILSNVNAARSEMQTAGDDPKIDGYACPHCGAPLPAKADVSPLGDAKCTFCHAWFNIHQKTA